MEGSELRTVINKRISKVSALQARELNEFKLFFQIFTGLNAALFCRVYSPPMYCFFTLEIVSFAFIRNVLEGRCELQHL